MQPNLFPNEPALQVGTIDKSAVFSACGNYRYQLKRVWDKTKPQLMFIMLNPSKADALNDDPTIRRCIGFAKFWGYGGFVVGNLFAYRSTDPKQIIFCEDPIGPDNKMHLDKMAAKSDIVVCAWGNSKIVDKLMKRFAGRYLPLKGITNLHNIELSGDGTPKHPLYLKGNLLPKQYTL